MTNEQKEKIIELRKLGIGYRSIATAMDLSRDSVRNFCKSRGLDGYGQDYIKPLPEKVIREHCKNCGKRMLKKRGFGVKGVSGNILSNMRTVWR